MDRNTRYNTSRAFNRLNDVNITQEQYDRVVGLAIMHLAAGNTDEYMLAMNSLGKTETTKDISNRLDKISAAVAQLTPVKETTE